VRVRQEIADAAIASGRAPDDVTVVAVTKSIDRVTVEQAFALGLRHFGENRVQEAAAKFATSPLPGASLHLIGQLQSNKAKRAIALFDVIESIDRLSIVEALEKEAARLGRTVSVLLQVNIAREPQKAGCSPHEAAALMARLASSPWLRPRGLMTIAPLVPNPEQARPVFAALRELRDRLQSDFPGHDLGTLSMGMSDDFRVAIEEGASSVRLGRAIFGARPAATPS
jgi:pyridoxal phosphate enzyme (YggS family)